jgi:quinol monooxygenase YgiN
MSQAVLTALGIIRAKPGKVRELHRRLEALLAPTRAEPGCLAYDHLQSIDDPAAFVLVERWRSARDLQAHVDMGHIVAFLAASADVVDGSPQNFRLSAPLDGDVE